MGNHSETRMGRLGYRPPEDVPEPEQQVLLALRRERLEFTVDGAQRVRKLLQLPAGLADLRA